MSHENIQINKRIYIYNKNIRVIHFQKHRSILETLESNNITTNFQCREGYCGICRTLLIHGTIQYIQQPLACIQKYEILICCSLPITNIEISL